MVQHKQIHRNVIYAVQSIRISRPSGCFVLSILNPWWSKHELFVTSDHSSAIVFYFSWVKKYLLLYQTLLFDLVKKYIKYNLGEWPKNLAVEINV